MFLPSMIAGNADAMSRLYEIDSALIVYTTRNVNSHGKIQGVGMHPGTKR